MRRRTRPCRNWPVLPARWRSSYDDSDQGPGPIRRTRDRLGAGEGDRPRSPAAPSGLARAVDGLPAGVPVPADRFFGPERGAANYPELSALGVAELEGLAIGYGGTALCLEARDLHVSIAWLVSASQPLMELAATVIAVRNGSRRTEAKAQASRENERKGGRPRKAEAI